MFKTAQKGRSKNISLEINRLLACNLLVYLRITTESPGYRFLLFVIIANKHDKHLMIVLPCSLEITLSNGTTAIMINSTNFILNSIVRCQEAELASLRKTCYWFRMRSKRFRVV